MIEFEKPNITVVEQEDSYGKFVVEPLERGFGTTLGNSLRRVLLTSIPGTGLVYVQIDGVLHGAAQGTDQYRHKSTNKYHAQSEQIQRYASLAKGTEKAGTDFQSQLIHKKHESEAFGIVQHARIDGQADMSCHNAGEKHKCHT